MILALFTACGEGPPAPSTSIAPDPVVLQREILTPLATEMAQLRAQLRLHGYEVRDGVAKDLRHLQGRVMKLPLKAPLSRYITSRLLYDELLNDLMRHPETIEITLLGGDDFLGTERREPVALVDGVERLVPAILRNASPDALVVSLRDSTLPARRVESGDFYRTFVALGASKGQRSTVLPFEAAGRRFEVEVPVAVRPSVKHSFRVEDEHGDPTPSRLYVSASDGRSYPPHGSSQRRNVNDETYYYVPGEFEITLPEGSAELEFVRGFEYLENRVRVDSRVVDFPPAHAKVVRLERWIDMPSLRWFSGDGHVHMNYNVRWPHVEPAAAFLMQRAEDLNVANMMVSNASGDDVKDARYFEGRSHELSLPRYQMRWNEEYRHDLLGYLVLYGLDSLTTPIYGGFEGTPHPFAVPLNADIADQALAQGGYVTGPHASWGHSEHAIDIALGKMGGLEVMGYGVMPAYGILALHRFWSTGFRTVATAGTDVVLNSPYSDPMGGARCYAHVEGDFGFESWLAAVREGRTFVSNGPVVFLSVDGHEVGSEIRRDRASAEPLRIRAEAVSKWPLEDLALFFNGQVIAENRDGGKRLTLESSLLPLESGWIAARVRGPANRLVFGGGMAPRQPQLAHTSPVWVVVDGRAQPPSPHAEALVDWTDAFTQRVERIGRFESQVQRDHMRAVYGEARTRFEAMAEEYRRSAKEAALPRAP